jgi:peptidoglycan/xylan/chitin deacetylase (PgdA/CDA1 family)
MRRLSPKAIILLYHRVADVEIDPQLLSVSPAHFSEHMQVLSEFYHPKSLGSIYQEKRTNYFPNHSVMVTFDDGYADNFLVAQNILKAYEIPATVFVTSRMVDNKKEYWWDELERVFLSPNPLPRQLELLINNEIISFEFASELPGSEFEAWNVLSKSPRNSRQDAYLFLMGFLRKSNFSTRENLLSEIFAWAGLDRDLGRLKNISASSKLLSSLPKNGFIDVGAHTVTHPQLSSLSQSEQESEISGSKFDLEQILDRPIYAFAYPFGERRDYSKDSIRLVRQAGFNCACSNFSGLTTWLTDPFQLPRYIVRDWDGETFSKKLRGWFES